MMLMVIFFFKHKTAYEVRISDWSSDVCSSDLPACGVGAVGIDDQAGVDDVLLRLRHLLGTADGDRRPGADMHGQAVFPLHFRRPARKSVVEGKSVSVRVDLGGRRIIKKKTQHVVVMFFISYD